MTLRRDEAVRPRPVPGSVSPLEPFRPRFRDRRFWAVQGLILLIAMLDAALGHMEPASPPLAAASVTLFFLPVTYAALNFGLAGSLATAVWCVLLAGAVVALRQPPGIRVEECCTLVAVLGVAGFAGRRVDAEMRSRQAAERAERARRTSEARYRNLFEASPAPVLLVGGRGELQEANPAAADLLGLPSPGLRPGHLAEAAGPVWGALAGSVVGGSGQRPPVLVRRPGKPELWLQPLVSQLPGAGEERLFQVLLRDLTEERQRHESLRAYAGAILRGQEDERRRIAQELHDDAVQSMIVLCRQVDAIEERCGPLSADAVAALHDLRGSLQGLVQSLRTLTHDLRPSVLDDLGLVASIRRLVADLEERSGTAGCFGVRGGSRRLASDAELGLFRIVQESLHNVERHARARHVWVRLSFGETAVRAVVRDDGDGFRPPDRPDPISGHGLGLLGMRERAALLGGSLDIRSRVGGGTAVRVVVRQPQQDADMSDVVGGTEA